ncbi:MAG: EamA family transporter [Deltaproteobacteria bacterium]|nr:EamA family transporter [Deltaproteobacteria bacterium]
MQSTRNDAAEPAAHTPRSTYLFLAIGLVCASQSANIIRIGDAHPVAIAAWRLLLASLLLLPLAWNGLKEIAALKIREKLLLILTGVMMALHLVIWIAGVQRTSVANATLLFSIQPLLTVLGAYLVFGEKPQRRIWTSITLGLLGVGVLGASNIRFSPDKLAGDGLAMLTAAFFAAYLLLGRHLRKYVADNTAYVSAVFMIAALAAFALFPFLNLPWFDYSGRNWWCFILMALIPTFVGHTSFTNALRYMEPAKISVATLLEPFFASIVAYAVWHEPITIYAVAGYILISLAVLILFWNTLVDLSAPLFKGDKGFSPPAFAEPDGPVADFPQNGFYEGEAACKEVCLEVRAISPKGRGVFALRTFRYGDVLERSPVIVLSADQWRICENTALHNYAFGWGPDQDQAAIALGFGSLFNHSFEPNAFYRKRPEEEVIEFVALRDIRENEEITVNYNGSPYGKMPVWFKDV